MTADKGLRTAGQNSASAVRSPQLAVSDRREEPMIEITHAGDQAYTYRVSPTDPKVVERKSNRAYARWVKHLTCMSPTMATKTVLALRGEEMPRKDSYS